MPVGGSVRASRRGRRTPAWWGRAACSLVGALLILIAPAAPASAASGASTTATPVSGAAVQRADEGASGELGWTLAEAKRAVTSQVISRVTGAPAQVDTAAVTAAIAGRDIRVIMLPFRPLEEKARDAAGKRGIDLKDWASNEKGIDLIEVQGLQVGVDIFDVVPSSIAELAPVLSQMDVTNQVLFAVSHLTKGKEPPDPDLPGERPANPQQVSVIGDALAAHRIYNDPDLAEAQTIQRGWNAGNGLTVRAAFLPPAEPGTKLTDLLTPLHQRFPDDVVVVVRGRWMEVAGPHQDLLHSSLLWTYGYYSRGVLGWQVAPSVLVKLLAERVATLRTGVVTDQPEPPEPTDPVSSVSRALPWIFAGVAVALVVAVTLGSAFSGRGDRAARAAENERSTRERRSLGARLAVLAGQTVAIEPLVHGHSVRQQFSSAMERYRTASDVLSSDGSLPVARDAVDAAERDLRQVAAAVGVPLARPQIENGGDHGGAG